MIPGGPGGPYPGGPMPGGPGGPYPPGSVPSPDVIGNLSGEQIVSNLEVVPVSFISVRGIFRRQQQIKSIADAMGLKTEQAEQLLIFFDFKLERQESSDGGRTWTEWSGVDKNVAIDYLQKSPDWEPDVVSAAIFDSVITMSLPSRLMGLWNNYVDHPELKNFSLSKEEMELEVKLNAKVLQELKDEASKQNTTKIREPGGFGQIQRGTRQAQETYFANTSTDQIIKEFEAELKKYDGNEQKAIIERIKKRVGAEGNLILFRYLDFDVKPGKSYQYRVQLQLANPAYGMSAEKAEKLSIVEQELRDTPWSNSTEPAFIDRDSVYVVKRVELPRNFLEPKATFDVMEVNQTSGTIVQADIEVAVGEYIKDTKKVHIIRPDKRSFEQEEVEFFSENMLLDIKGIGKVDSAFHKDLSFPNKFVGDITTPSMTLVMNESGNLIAKNPASDYADVARLKKKKIDQDKAWEEIKDAQTKAATMPTGPDGAPLSMDMGGEYQFDGGFTQFADPNRDKNMLRKGNKVKPKQNTTNLLPVAP